MNWRLFTGFVVSLLLVFPLATPSVKGQDVAGCRPAKSRTVIANRSIRLFTVPAKSKVELDPLFGCLTSIGRSRLLSPIETSTNIFLFFPLELHAPWVAGVTFHLSNPYSYENAVTARNLRSGRSVQCHAVGGGDDNSGVGVDDVVVTGKGSMAWVGERYGGEVGLGPGKVGIVETCEHGQERRLDVGEGIDLKSLALDGSTVSWINAGAERSATLR